MTDAQRAFAQRAIERRRLFRNLSIVGVLVGLGLLGWFGYRHTQDSSYELGLPITLAVMVLLNARQNLRQYRYAGILHAILEQKGPPEA
jgi:hypothetical protein